MTHLYRGIHSKGIFRIISLAAGMATVLTIAVLSPVAALGQPVLETVLYSFGAAPDGSSPNGGLVLGIDNALYGAASKGGTSTNGDGTIYKVNLNGTGYTTLHNFTNSPDGSSPAGTLIFGNDGLLYGVTSGGGANSSGIIFRMHLDGTGYQILHDFNAATDGSLPLGGLMQATNGALYGTTTVGGTAGRGTLFTLQTDGGGFQVLHHFTNSPDGSSPQETLLQGNDGSLYGSTFFGGAANKGILFRIQLNGGGYEIVHQCTNTVDGTGPRGTLLQATDGAIYGAMQAGGGINDGTLFKMNPDGSGYTVLHSFISGPDGARPVSGLVQGLNNMLYGTTFLGGTNASGGTLYRMQLGGSGFETVYDFGAGNDGERPGFNLISGASLGASGVLYGVTTLGGAAGRGAVFAAVVNPSMIITPFVNQVGSNGPIVIWPGFAYNYVLQTSTNPATGPWVNITNGVPVTGLQITNLPNPSGAYFRLIWPQ